MRKMPTARLLLTGAGTGLIVMSLSSASASSANISHSYHTASTIAAGSLVSLDPTKTDYVVPANTDNASKLFGITVANNDSLLEVNASQDTTQVATSGAANALVSTLGGDISVGDAVTVSPFNGIGMRADDNSGVRVIGLAQTAFNAKTEGAKEQQVTAKNGKKQTIYLGYISVSIGVGTAGNGQDKQSGLQRFAKSLTGHTVSTPRIILSIIVVIVSLAALVTLTYSAVYGSIVAIGRNPLAKFAILRTLSGVLGMGALTTLVAVVALFFLLR